MERNAIIAGMIILAIVLIGSIGAIIIISCGGSNDEKEDTPQEENGDHDTTNGDDYDNDTSNGDAGDIDETLRTEETAMHIRAHGNTNANLQNQGLATYDSDEQLHYFALGAAVYQFDPASNSTTQVFEVENQGVITHLNFYDNILYFLTTEDGYLMQYDIEEDDISIISEAYHTWLMKGNNRFFVYYYREMFELYAFGYINVSNNSYASNPINNASYPNSVGTRVFYQGANSVLIRLASDNQFMGQTTVVNLADYDMIALDAMIMLEITDQTTFYFAFIGQTEHTKHVYTYHTDDGLETLYGDASDALRNLNYDGENLYFFDGEYLMQIDLTTQELETVAEVGEGATDLQLINHWIYYRLENDLWRIDPATQTRERINP